MLDSFFNCTNFSSLLHIQIGALVAFETNEETAKDGSEIEEEKVKKKYNSKK
jgi:hypothetical protein